MVEDSVAEMVAEVTGTAVSSGPFGANFSPKVEGTVVVITRMTVGIVGNFWLFYSLSFLDQLVHLCFHFLNLSYQLKY